MAPIVSYSHRKSARHISKHIMGFLVGSLNIFIENIKVYGIVHDILKSSQKVHKF